MRKLKIFLIFVLTLSIGSMFGQAVDQTFNSSGTYTITNTPTGCSTIKVQVWGGGGGSNDAGLGARGGGGGGGYTEATFTVIGSASFPVTVGAGGPG
jgi:hypothetical protein